MRATDCGAGVYRSSDARPVTNSRRFAGAPDAAFWPSLAPSLARVSKHNTPTKPSASGFRCLNSESFAPEPLFVHGFAHQRADGRRMRTAAHADQADLAPELGLNDRQRHHARVPGGIRR